METLNKQIQTLRSEGKSYSEIAETLGISKSKVARILGRSEVVTECSETTDETEAKRSEKSFQNVPTQQMKHSETLQSNTETEQNQTAYNFLLKEFKRLQRENKENLNYIRELEAKIYELRSETSRYKNELDKTKNTIQILEAKIKQEQKAKEEYYRALEISRNQVIEYGKQLVQKERKEHLENIIALINNYNGEMVSSEELDELLELTKDYMDYNGEENDYLESLVEYIRGNLQNG